MDELRFSKKQQRTAMPPHLVCTFFKFISYIFQRKSDKYIQLEVQKHTLHHHIWSFVSGMSTIQRINLSESNKILFRDKPEVSVPCKYCNYQLVIKGRTVLVRAAMCCCAKHSLFNT